MGERSSSLGDFLPQWAFDRNWFIVVAIRLNNSLDL